jgi:hypothetical protein
LRTQDSSRRALFDRDTFVALLRATHPERRLATAAARLRVRELDRQPDTATAWVYGAYATLLGRLPDAGGLSSHEALLRQGASPADIVARMSTSDEAGDNSTGTPANVDDIFVTGAYLVALGRRPDPAGAEAQRAALAAGLDHADVLIGLLQSPEAREQLRFPPAPPSPEEQLARSVQEVVVGSVDPELHRILFRAAREGRSVPWMIRTTLRRRGGRRALVRGLPRSVWLGRRARRRAAATSALAAIESTAEWNWRVQRRLMNDVARLSQDVAALRSQSAPR